MRVAVGELTGLPLKLVHEQEPTTLKRTLYCVAPVGAVQFMVALLEVIPETAAKVRTGLGSVPLGLLQA